jgi:hypothetical protein
MTHRKKDMAGGMGREDQQNDKRLIKIALRLV